MFENGSRQTVAVTNGIATDPAFGAVTPPVYLSSTFAFEGFQQARRYDYTRTANPSRDLLADTLAKLEGGAGAVVVSSGMAAIDLLLAQLNRTDLVVAPHDCYAGTYRLLNARHERQQFDVLFVDQTDEKSLSVALERRPALVLVETPSNPLMRVTDVRALAAHARVAGAKLAVDNTFLSPALQMPLTLGADFVIHSTTKYLNGHSDVVGGAVIAANQTDVANLANWANVTGVAGAPFDAYLTLRGLRTLFPRIEAQQRTAAALARRLRQHPRVRAVYYPGLESHPGHAIAKAQQTGFGAMLSFDLVGDVGDVRRFVDALKLFTLAESLGGVESLIAHPATMTHSCLSPEVRRIAGISDTLLRLSVGLEAEDDLWADLSQGFRGLAEIDDQS
ncbi:MAG: cystathionine gamma-synthase [Alphaproteobacteria bacterium]|nr:cystathionine gamma-synthase [Alphaproteobacteria bacterium]